MREQPLVSVLMTAFNRELFIAQAIESVLQSSYTNFELIIVDDGSVDDTVEIAQRYQQYDTRVKVFINEKNLGDYANRNKAAGYASGKYLKYLDSDDYFLNGGLQYCVEAMESCGSADWGICAKDPSLANKLFNGEKIIPMHFFKKPVLTIGPGGMIIRRSFFMAIGMFPLVYGPANDMYFNLKAATKGLLLMMEDNFLYYRIHDGQEANNKYSYLYNNYNYLRDAIKQLELPLNYKQKQWLDKKNKRRFTVNIIKYLFRVGDFTKTRSAICKAEFSAKDAIQGIFH